jgi:hypothetical protein
MSKDQLPPKKISAKIQTGLDRECAAMRELSLKLGYKKKVEIARKSTPTAQSSFGLYGLLARGKC